MPTAPGKTIQDFEFDEAVAHLATWEAFHRFGLTTYGYLPEGATPSAAGQKISDLIGYPVNGTPAAISAFVRWTAFKVVTYVRQNFPTGRHNIVSKLDDREVAMKIAGQMAKSSCRIVHVARYIDQAYRFEDEILDTAGEPALVLKFSGAKSASAKSSKPTPRKSTTQPAPKSTKKPAAKKG